MTITTDALINFFEDTTLTSLATTTSAVSAGAFSDGTNDLLEWTNTDDSPWAAFVLECDPASSPAVGSYVMLYTRLMEIDGASNHAPVPTANFPDYEVGRFLVENSATKHYIPRVFWLPAMFSQQKHNFYIRNQMDVSMSAGWDLSVNSMTVGPHG